MRAHAVQEVAVVGDDDHGAVTRREYVFQPADGVNVQVVGWFVEQQHFRVGKQCLRQQHAQFPAGGYLAHRAEMLLQRNTQAQQQLTSARLGRITVHLGEIGFQLCHRHAVFFAHFWQRIDALAFGLDLPQLLMTHDHRVDDIEVLVGELILPQLAEAHVGLEHDLACGRLKIATEDFHERRLAGPVGADQAVAIAIAKFDGDVFKQRLGAKLHGDVSCRNQEALSRGFQSVRYRLVHAWSERCCSFAQIPLSVDPAGVRWQQHSCARPSCWDKGRGSCQTVPLLSHSCAGSCMRSTKANAPNQSGRSLIYRFVVRLL